MSYISLTVFSRPHGQSTECLVDLSHHKQAYETALEVIKADFTYNTEQLQTGEVVFYICDNDLEYDFATDIVDITECMNTDTLTKAFAKFVRKHPANVLEDRRSYYVAEMMEQDR